MRPAEHPELLVANEPAAVWGQPAAPGQIACRHDWIDLHMNSSIAFVPKPRTILASFSYYRVSIFLKADFILENSKSKID